ncbi:Hydrolase, alpha/beta fold family [hydrothermal vent metagenome]|uniref:Hydrolase, alpha/beta fold family n=1 Tax=hydrothermal vent metagenome TaxID=652676 RepID=A0A1W1C0U8_9ZZZZ
MLKIILKTLPFIFFVLIFFTACSVKVPITWKERILDKKVKKLSLAYSEYGKKDKPTLLFLHGFGENRYTWRFLVPRLSMNYHLIMVDLKGFGDSPKTKDDYYSVYDQALIVNDFIKEKNLKNITLVGRSFGGGVSLVLALLQKDKLIEKRIDKMILIDTMSYKQNLPSMLRDLKRPVIGYLGIHLLSNRYMATEAYKYAFYNKKLIPKNSIKYSSIYLSFPKAKYAYLKTVNQLIPDDIDSIEKRFSEINIPTLILWGKNDVAIRVDKAYRLHRDIKNSSIKVFNHAGHMIQEEIPELVSSEIIKFMEENQ